MIVLPHVQQMTLKTKHCDDATKMLHSMQGLVQLASRVQGKDTKGISELGLIFAVLAKVIARMLYY